ncbi:hypothetical protein CALVIDRAFT_88272 [Calocera viscosa TUFC12733]|uniref:Uncharacterized protein n=1 Tax=Calocera viscosa (strain TUFC12733) TaxID=1330018 RepID=A0A167N7J4_CALVF|nr:hypothetical protein CALVIDRAFT_88272 [Calocera viscosa TUFC12733]
MGKGYANGTASGPRRAQRNRGTVTPPSPPSASPVRRSYASSSPSISPPFAERTPDHPSRLAEKVNASPTEAPNPSYTLVPHAPRAPAPHQGQSTPPSYTAAYNYYSVRSDHLWYRFPPTLSFTVTSHTSR